MSYGRKGLDHLSNFWPVSFLLTSCQLWVNDRRAVIGFWSSLGRGRIMTDASQKLIFAEDVSDQSNEVLKMTFSDKSRKRAMKIPDFRQRVHLDMRTLTIANCYSFNQDNNKGHIRQQSVDASRRPNRSCRPILAPGFSVLHSP